MTRSSEKVTGGDGYAGSFLYARTLQKVADDPSPPVTTRVTSSPSETISAIFRRDQTAFEETRRRMLALQDARDHVRRAASAAAAASVGDSDQARAAMLSDARRRLLAVLAELERMA
jgi:hypothetical protein